jgi:phenylalanyl-tRNA synthetase beta chain
MICSQLELGLGEDHTGIIVLPDDAPVGVPLDTYLGDTVLDLELTPNRLDCLSMLGVAHEVAALTGKTVREPDLAYSEDGPPVGDRVSVEVVDPDLCYRYTASLISGLTIGPSPHWLQERLTKAGLRPINNVVDATNYVMLEYNQPLHAFDYGLLQDRTIIVRRAKNGEKLATLDGVERQLNEQVLVIADSQDPVGLGGVIGGANSEISPGTTSVLLESATFDAYNNRETAQNFRLRTEATLRFEKGLRPELAPIALRRATQLIQQVAGGSVAPGIIDVFPGQERLSQPVTLTASRLERVLGMQVGQSTVVQVLESLGIKTRDQGPGWVQVDIPYWRNDLTLEDDLVEEVVRIIGYDSVPVTMLSTPIPYQRQDPHRRLVDGVKDGLAASGMQEVISYPAVNADDLGKIEWTGALEHTLRLANPLNSREDCLRPTLRLSLLETLAANQGHSEGPFRFFEVGRVFRAQSGDLPEEREIAAGILAGQRWAPSWLEDQGRLDFYDAKGVVEGLLEGLEVLAEYEPVNEPFFGAGRCAHINYAKHELGTIGEVSLAITERFGLRHHPVVYFELHVDRLLESLPDSGKGFFRPSRYPAATRDLALVVPVDVAAARVQGVITRHRLVEHAELFDIYTGENIPAGTKSLAFHVYFQSQDRTLTTDEVNRSLQGLLRSLEREVQASLRN